MKSKIIVFVSACAVSSSLGAQTKWDMPTPYSDGDIEGAPAAMQQEAGGIVARLATSKPRSSAAPT